MGGPLVPLSKETAEFWLSRSELGLVVFAVIVIVGLIGEYVEGRRAKKWIPDPHPNRIPWHTVWEWVVIAGIVGELFADGGVWVTSDGLQAISNREGTELRTQAADALDKAAKAERDATNLMAENVELEHELAPRNFDILRLFSAVSAFPRIPLYAEALNEEEPRTVLRRLHSAFADITTGGKPQWSFQEIADDHRNINGIIIEYFNEDMLTKDLTQEHIATAICESLKQDGINVNTDAIPFAAEWPKDVPRDAVLIRVGSKTVRFWENKEARKRGLPERDRDDFCTAQEAADAMRARDALHQKAEEPKPQ